VVEPAKIPDGSSRAQVAAESAAARARAARRAKAERAVLVVSLVAGLAATGVIVHKHRSAGDGGDSTVKTLGDIGVTPFISGCGGTGPTNDPVPTQDDVVPPGTKQQYPEVPPSAGPHLANPVAVNGGAFYTAADRPPIEGLVANLNAGWTVLWYDPNGLAPGQVDLIKKAAEVLHNDRRYSTFVASEWDAGYGAMPAGTPIALVRWTKTDKDNHGHRAFCHEVSGEAILQYMIYYGAPAAVGETD
jgi:hypothetical protein